MDCQQILANHALKILFEKVIEILAEESNVVVVKAPVSIVGDVHGQFYDLQKMFSLVGEPPKSNYVFMGDYVDRGYHSLETFLLLITYKVMHPQHVTLLRGNHESRQISTSYGFYEEVQKKYGSPSIWRMCNEVFDYLPLAALVNNDILCLHGGLSPDIKTLDDIEDIDRVCQIPTSGGFGDIVWSDPDEIENWMLSTRGVGWLFGARPTAEFNEFNSLKLIVRSHQLVESGHQTWFSKQNLVTVWSAPNYCYRCGNSACTMKVQQDGSYNYNQFSADARSQQSVHYQQVMPYFL